MRQAHLEGHTGVVMCPPGQSRGKAEDERSSHLKRSQDCVAVMLRSPRFDILMGFFLFIDFGLRGVEAEQRLHPESASPASRRACDALDLLCKLVYLVELLLRVYAFGLRR